MSPRIAFLHFLHLLHELFGCEHTARQQFGRRPVQAQPAAKGIVSYRRYNKPALGPLGDSFDDMGARS